MLVIAIDLAINISGLLFLIFMMVVYFSKKNMNNIDNVLYRLMLIFNFCNSFFHVFFLVAEWYAIKNHLLVSSLIKSYWVPLQCYGVIMLFYIYITLKDDDKDFIIKLNQPERKKKLYLYLCIGIAIISALMIFLPLDLTFNEEGIVILMAGPCTAMFYVMLIVLYLYVIYALFVFRKKTNKSKALTFKIMFIFLTGGFILSAMYPQLCVTEFLLIIISYLMFHTIENPDLKLVNQLKLAKEQAEKSSNAKSEFLASMSHELRTPLNAIVGLSGIIKDSSTDMDSRSDAADIFNSSTKLLELVDGILDINKLESNEMEVVEKQYNPLQLFENCIKSAKVRLGNKPIELRTSYSEDIPSTLFGDSDKIKIILNNLLSNAVKYTESGMIKLAVDAFVVKDKCNLTFTVSDTGRGIPEEHIQNLFTKFYRMDEDKDSDIEGTGLGLSITKSVVELLDGKINVSSVFGEGTTFTVNVSQKLLEEENSVVEDKVQEPVVQESKPAEVNIVETPTQVTPVQESTAVEENKEERIEVL